MIEIIGGRTTIEEIGGKDLMIADTTVRGETVKVKSKKILNSFKNYHN